MPPWLEVSNPQANLGEGSRDTVTMKTLIQIQVAAVWSKFHLADFSMHSWYTHIYAYLDDILITDPTENRSISHLSKKFQHDLKR